MILRDAQILRRPAVSVDAVTVPAMAFRKNDNLHMCKERREVGIPSAGESKTAKRGTSGDGAGYIDARLTLNPMKEMYCTNARAHWCHSDAEQGLKATTGAMWGCMPEMQALCLTCQSSAVVQG